MIVKRPTPTDVDLMRGAQHVIYATGMLVNTGTLLTDMRWEPSSWEEQTKFLAVYEVNLTHARALLEFLFPTRDAETNRRKHRDIFASDYCTSPWEPESWSGRKADYERITRQITHLSFDRAQEPVIEPDHALRDRISRAMLAFVDEADLFYADGKYWLRNLAAKGRMLDGLS